MNISKITIINTNQEFLVACDPLKIKSFILSNSWSHFYFEKDKINPGDNLNKLLYFSHGKFAVSFLNQNYKVEIFEQLPETISLSEPNSENLQNDLENDFNKSNSENENLNEDLKQDLENETSKSSSDLEKQNPENSDQILEPNQAQKRFSKNHKKNR